MKYCPSCKTNKPLSCFYKKTTSTGRITVRSYCIDCGKRARDKWRKESPKDNDRNKAYNKENAKELRGKKLVKKYWPNLTWQEALAEWNRMYEEQGGLCAFGHKVKILQVDHCHETGVVRGLLCYNCNNGLGRFKDDIEVLKMTVPYIEKPRKKNTIDSRLHIAYPK